MNSSDWSALPRPLGSPISGVAPWFAAVITLPNLGAGSVAVSGVDLAPPPECLPKNMVTVTHHQLTRTTPDQPQWKIGWRCSKQAGWNESEGAEITHKSSMLPRVVVNGEKTRLTTRCDLPSPGHGCGPDQGTNTGWRLRQHAHGVELKAPLPGVGPALQFAQKVGPSSA